MRGLNGGHAVRVNTRDAILYELLTQSALSTGSAWASEKLLPGIAPAITTSIDLGSRTNLFFWARFYDPTNGQVFITLDSAHTSLAAYVNGQSNVYTTFLSTVAAIPGPVRNLNIGYHAEDYAPEPSPPPSDMPRLDPQNAIAVAGLTTDLTNFCASHNPLTRLDLSGLANLQDVECFQCAQLGQVDVRNCASLKRACLEQCNIGGVLDFTGCTALQDIRGAKNRYTNVVFGGAGPAIYHLCVRDNPQLCQNVSLTNFFSLSEWYAWNCSQTGAVTSVSMPSSALSDVEVFSNRFEFADFSDKTNLRTLQIGYNSLTNIIVTNCLALRWFEAQNNKLTTNALDEVLVSLRPLAQSLLFVDLSGNGPASPSGYDSYSYLTNHGVGVRLDFPDTNNVPGPSNAVTFVTTDQKPHLEVAAPGATIVWHWGDGYCATNLNNSEHDFGSATMRTNYVIIDPTNALTSFGQYNNNGEGHIFSVTNLAAFPNLDTLSLWQDNLVDLDISRCASLRHLYLAGNTNTCSSSTVDGWFKQLTNAVPGTVSSGSVFYYPSGTGPGTPTEASAAARSWLTAHNWTLTSFP